CRYPGTPFESEASDAIFQGMVPHIDGAVSDLPGVQMLFLIGDQIYADATANIVDSRAPRERYGQRYRGAFTSKNARRVLAHVPTQWRSAREHYVGAGKAVGTMLPELRAKSTPGRRGSKIGQRRSMVSVFGEARAMLPRFRHGHPLGATASFSRSRAASPP